MSDCKRCVTEPRHKMSIVPTALGFLWPYMEVLRSPDTCPTLQQPQCVIES